MERFCTCNVDIHRAAEAAHEKRTTSAFARSHGMHEPMFKSVQPAQ